MKAGTVTTNSQRDTRNSATRGRSVPRAVRAPGAQSVSLWQATERIPLRPALRRATSVDVCVVGGGIAGLSTAYHLALAGRSVVVLEHGSIGGGQTGRTSAHLSNAMDVQYQVIRRLHGVRGAELAAESHTRAIARIGEISEREHITCDLESVDGYLFLAPGASESVLERELEATRDAGLTGVEWLARTPWPGYEMGPCLRFPAQAQFHPLRYLRGLASAIERHGGRIHCRSRVESIEGGPMAMIKTTTGRRVKAGAVVVATTRRSSTSWPCTRSRWRI